MNPFYIDRRETLPAAREAFEAHRSERDLTLELALIAVKALETSDYAAQYLSKRLAHTQIDSALKILDAFPLIEPRRWVIIAARLTTLALFVALIAWLVT